MASSVRNNHSAYQRTQAAFLAYDMVDRMRANRAAAVAAANNYNVAIGAASAAAASLALTDVTDWKTALSTTLPAGDGSVAVVVNAATGAAAATVKVQWNDARGTGGITAQQVQVDTQL